MQRRLRKVGRPIECIPQTAIESNGNPSLTAIVYNDSLQFCCELPILQIFLSSIICGNRQKICWAHQSAWHPHRAGMGGSEGALPKFKSNGGGAWPPQSGVGASAWLLVVFLCGAQWWCHSWGHGGLGAHSLLQRSHMRGHKG